jgi:excisionase family DNA binding protein
MTEPLTEDGVRRLLVAIFRAASDVLSGESGDETPPAPSPAPREPNLTSGDRATLTVDEVAEILGISRGSAYEGCRRGEIPSLRVGRRIVVPAHQLQAHLSGPGRASSQGDDLCWVRLHGPQRASRAATMIVGHASAPSLPDGLIVPEVRHIDAGEPAVADDATPFPPVRKRVRNQPVDATASAYA